MKYKKQLLDLINYAQSKRTPDYFFEVYIGGEKNAILFVTRLNFNKKYEWFPDVFSKIELDPSAPSYIEIYTWINQQICDVENNIKLYLEKKTSLKKLTDLSNP